MDGATIEEAPAGSAYRLRGRQVVALAVIGVCALLSLWGTPREASSAAFATALHEGQVTGWELDTGHRYGVQGTAFLEVRLGESPPSTSVVWADTSGRLYRTDLTTLLTLPDPGSDPVLDPSVDPLAGEYGGGTTVDVGRTIAANTPQGHQLGVEGLGWAGKLNWPLGAVTIAGFFLLVMGTQPRRRTKWATFWYLLIPLGAGLAWVVARDAPWSEQMNDVPEPAPRQRGEIRPGLVRTGGGRAFWFAWAASLVLAVGVFGLVSWVPGFGARPEPPQGSTTWNVVWPDGHTGSLVEQERLAG